MVINSRTPWLHGDAAEVQIDFSTKAELPAVTLKRVDTDDGGEKEERLGLARGSAMALARTWLLVQMTSVVRP